MSIVSTNFFFHKELICAEEITKIREIEYSTKENILRVNTSLSGNGETTFLSIIASTRHEILNRRGNLFLLN